MPGVWYFLNARRIKESLEDQPQHVKDDVTDGCIAILQDPHNPPGLSYWRYRGKEHPGAYVAEVAPDWYLTYQPFEELPPLGHVIKIIALVPLE